MITPLTDRCYITLSQALGMCLGGAPAGPAGTGKTETTKDMGSTLGKLVLVTNCGDQMDYRSTGKIFKGSAQAGCGAASTSSTASTSRCSRVVAQQVASSRVHQGARGRSFQFTDGQIDHLDKEVGYFITMNPGYAGRQELPENLKSLFRGVMMMVPDRQIIMKVKLTGAATRRTRSRQEVQRALRALRGAALASSRTTTLACATSSPCCARRADQARRPLGPEQMLLMRTLRDMNLSKFVAEDVPLFLSLIEDLFPRAQGRVDEAPGGGGLAREAHPRVQPATARHVGAQGHPDVRDVAGAPLAHARRPLGHGQVAHRRGAHQDPPGGACLGRPAAVRRPADGRGPHEPEGHPGAADVRLPRPWSPTSGPRASSPRCGARPTRTRSTSLGSCSTAPSTPSGSRT